MSGNLVGYAYEQYAFHAGVVKHLTTRGRQSNTPLLESTLVYDNVSRCENLSGSRAATASNLTHPQAWPAKAR
jgi:hypothetical protein